MHEENRIQFLQPQQILKKMAICPVAYIPLGVLEWHGEHNPYGADTLQAEGIAFACAKKSGGLVFPPLYYGLLQGLMETIPRFQTPILERMGWEKRRFDINQMLDKAYEERERYVHLLVHMLCQAEAMGFKLAVFVAGHYPLIDHARAAVIEFTDSRKFDDSLPAPMLAWAFADYLLIEKQYPNSGDHGACWETSHLLYLNPETVDMSLIAEKDEDLIGVLISNKSPREASAEFGCEIIDKAVDAAIPEINDRLAHPNEYRNHGRCLTERLWEKRMQNK